MRVLILNTSENAGGAAVAAGRLTDALNNSGVKARMLVGRKLSDRLTVASASQPLRLRAAFLWERLTIFLHLHLRRRHLFEVDTASAGIDPTLTREYEEADIIHLHWVNQGFLSLASLRKILRSGKPVVWTMHDMWPATAICHLTLGCERYRSACSHCPLMPRRSLLGDLAQRVWRRKQTVYATAPMSFVTCSEWLAGEARASRLLEGHTVTSIPNPIDTRIFSPSDRNTARRALSLPLGKRIITFIAQRVTNPNKGMDYLIEACRQLAQEHPAMLEDTCVALLGGQGEQLAASLPFETISLGYITDAHRIAQVYSASDVFVLPSLSENLPNTIMEAMACGIPSVGFHVGGIPEMIDHRANGYVARYRDSRDLAAGLHWALYEADADSVRRACLGKVARCYSPRAVAARYIEVYNNALHKKK